MSDPSARIESTVPAEIDRWNWGAFLLNWIWGVGNNTFIALLTLIPVFGALIMPFVLGAKGSAWAWRNGRWDSVEHFKRVQRAWAIWGAVIWICAIVFFGSVIGGAFYFLRHSEAYELGVSKLQTSSEAADVLGPPISTGNPFGTISTNGASGRAILNFSVTGTKAAGRVFLEAIKQDGGWSIRSFTLKVDGGNGMIDLLNGGKAETNSPHGGQAADSRYFPIPKKVETETVSPTGQILPPMVPSPLGSLGSQPADTSPFLQTPKKVATETVRPSGQISLSEDTSFSSAKMTPQQWSLLDEAMISQYKSCWNDMSAQTRSVVAVAVEYRNDGALASLPRLLDEPTDPASLAAAAGVLQAVTKCDPIKIPAEVQPFYEQWKKRVLRFGPTKPR